VVAADSGPSVSLVRPVQVGAREARVVAPDVRVVVPGVQVALEVLAARGVPGETIPRARRVRTVAGTVADPPLPRSYFCRICLCKSLAVDSW